MKIVMTVHTYWPKKDGVQYVTQYLAEGLVTRGHEVTVLTTCQEGKQQIESLNGVQIVRLRLKSKFSIFVFGKQEFRKEARAFLEDCDCLINCCVQSPCNNVLLSELKTFNGIKVLFMHGMHEFAIDPKERFDCKYLLSHLALNCRWALFYAYHRKDFLQYSLMVDIHAQSKALNFMKNLGYKGHTEIIQNAVENFDEISISEEDVCKYPLLGHRYVLCVANYNERKNQIALLNAFKNSDISNECYLVFIGRGREYANKLRRLIAQYDEGSVFIFEDLDRDLTCKYIKAATCAALSSRYEVYPIFLSESIACGVPFVSFNVGCVNDIPGGLVVETEEEMAEAFNKIFDNETLRVSLGVQGREFALQHFSQNEKIDQLENAIQSVWEN